MRAEWEHELPIVNKCQALCHVRSIHIHYMQCAVMHLARSVLLLLLGFNITSILISCKTVPAMVRSSSTEGSHSL